MSLKGEAIVSGGVVNITDIGEGADALICTTDQTDCCNEEGNAQGEWRFPNGTLVAANNAGGSFYRSRGAQRVLLNRRSNALGPVGAYCCEVRTITDSNANIICINMSK